VASAFLRWRALRHGRDSGYVDDSEQAERNTRHVPTGCASDTLAAVHRVILD